MAFAACSNGFSNISRAYVVDVDVSSPDWWYENEIRGLKTMFLNCIKPNSYSASKSMLIKKSLIKSDHNVGKMLIWCYFDQAP